MKRLVLLPLVAALVAGCGGEDTKGTASVWVTRDRGAHVLLVEKVPAGLTAMQALDRVADIETRYGGRFVQAINGIEGSLSGRNDWFYFVNGYEADRSAAEYVLHPGDVEWWDFRSWKDSSEVKVVVGAFPEPFLHGYNGKRLETLVISRYAPAGRAIAKMLHAGLCLEPSGRHGCGWRWRGNVVIVNAGFPGLTAETEGAGKAVRLGFTGDYHDLLNGKYRYRYEVKP